MITTEIEFSESLFRRLQAALDRYPNLSVSALCAEAIGCYLRLLDTAEEVEQTVHIESTLPAADDSRTFTRHVSGCSNSS